MSLASAPRIFHLSIYVIASISILLSSIMAEAQVTSPNKPFKFYMSAVAKVTKGEDHQFIPLQDNIALQTGSLIKFYFEFEKESFLYIFHKDSSGTLTILFPRERQPAKVAQYTPVHIPEGNSWIQLDSNTGKENIYFIVSSAKLENLESLSSKHINMKEKVAVKESSQSILAEIKAIARNDLKKQAERPLRIAGRLRGDPGAEPSIQQELLRSAVEITANRTYVKTIKIDHK